ncbi:MAG TPA: glycosyltransferase [Bacteroidota bacterium]|nr:glycosyltransferase [Bacteroidota bacterium]
MKIAFIGTRGIPHGYASAEQIAYQVGRRMVAKGHEFTVYCWKGLFEDRSPVYEGIRRVFIPTVDHKVFGQLLHGFLSGMHSVFHPYDVVHFQCLTMTFSAVIPRIVKGNIAVNVDGQEWDNPKWPKAARHLYFKSAVHATLAMCPEFITDAKGMYDIYEARYGRKSSVIEYGADLVSPQDPGLLKEYGLAPRGYFFVAARLVPSNQLHRIVKAFKASGSKRTLAIAGGGAFDSPYYRALRQDAPSNARFLGMISNQRAMDELYANAFAYLHGASLGGINSALLRPLGAGCPAIAFDTPFNREVLELESGGMCGEVWRDEEELAASIRRFEANEELVRTFSRESISQIRRKFSWDLVADQYEVFYRGIAERWAPEKIRAEVKRQVVRYAGA